jgi:hypothetical protein
LAIWQCSNKKTAPTILGQFFCCIFVP